MISKLKPGPRPDSKLRAKVRALVMQDRSLKEIAIELKAGPSRVCQFANQIGFRRMYVTAEERAHLMERRKIMEGRAA